MSDLFRNHIVGFPMRRLIYENQKKNTKKIGGECSGIVVEHQTQYQVVLGLIPTGSTVLSP